MTVEQEPETLEVNLVVYVPSAIKPGLQGRGQLKLNSGKDQSQEIGLVAGAAAEHLCENYNDFIDPSVMVETAMEAYAELRSENPHIF